MITVDNIKNRYSHQNYFLGMDKNSSVKVVSTDIKKNNLSLDQLYLYSSKNNYLVHFSGKALPAKFAELQLQQALAKKQRSNLPSVLQLMFPISSERPAIIKKMREDILQHPLIKNKDGFKQAINKVVSQDTGDSLVITEDKILKELSEKPVTQKTFPDRNLEGVSYSLLLQEAFKPYRLIKDLSIPQQASILRLLRMLNIDAKNLPQGLLASVNELTAHTKVLSSRGLLGEAVHKPLTDEELEHYMESNVYSVIQSLVLLGREPLMFRMGQKIYKFDRTIKETAKISLNPTLAKPLSKACNKPIEDKSKVIKTIELVSGLKSLNVDDIEVSNLLQRATQRRDIDTQVLETAYLRHFLKYAGMPNSEISELRDKDLISRFDLGFVYTIPSALDRFNKLNMDDHIQDLKKLVVSSFRDNYPSLLRGEQSISGKANRRTQELFESHGLDMETWLNYPVTRKFILKDKESYLQSMEDSKAREEIKSGKYSFPKKPQNYEVKIWDRKPGFDLFQGNYSKICVAMDGIHGFNSTASLLHNCIQLVELRKDNVPCGLGYMFWARKAESTKPILVVDGLAIPRETHGNPQIKSEVMKFVKSYASKVSGKESPVVIGHNFVPFNEFDSKYLFGDPEVSQMKIIGSTNEGRNYLDSPVVNVGQLKLGESLLQRYINIDENSELPIALRRYKE